MIELAEKIVGIYENCADTWHLHRNRKQHEKIWLDRFLELVPAAGKILDIAAVEVSQSLNIFTKRVTS